MVTRLMEINIKVRMPAGYINDALTWFKRDAGFKDCPILCKKLPQIIFRTLCENNQRFRDTE